jgi:flagellar basal-body rod protein FlgG
MRSLHIAATGMQAQQTNVEVISNDIANISWASTGNKKPNKRTKKFFNSINN